MVVRRGHDRGVSSMFVQVVRGVVADGGAAFARLDQWRKQLAPGAAGWLGTTAGITADDELVAFVRFATTADARANSDRVEQGMWWAESAVVFAGDVTFDNYEEVTLFGDGGSDAAALVEVVVGRVRRPAAGQQLAQALAAQGLQLGSSVIGGLVGLHADGHLTQAVYFSDGADGLPSGTMDPRALLGSDTRVSELRLLRLQRLWFGSPDDA
jgi:hypothetical protein